MIREGVLQFHFHAQALFEDDGLLTGLLRRHWNIVLEFNTGVNVCLLDHPKQPVRGECNGRKAGACGKLLQVLGDILVEYYMRFGIGHVILISSLIVSAGDGL